MAACRYQKSRGARRAEAGFGEYTDKDVREADADDHDDFQIEDDEGNATDQMSSKPSSSRAETNNNIEGVSLDDFHAYMPQHSYIFAPSRDLWPASSVNARVPPIIGPDGKPIPAAKWLDTHAAVEQMTWAPGLPMLIEDKLISDGGWIERPGCTVFNLYRAPSLKPKAGNIAPWLNLVRNVFPNEADHIITWLAHRLQRPHEKVNHALVLGGKPGIGKDTILEPIKQAIGPWNFADVSPKQVLGRFNGFLKSVILRVNEARDLGEFDRYAFHDHMKAYIAAPPDVNHIDEKNVKEYYVFNLCGVIITSNHKTDGIYLPADDRRHMVAWSNLSSDTRRSLHLGTSPSPCRRLVTLGVSTLPDLWLAKRVDLQSIQRLSLTVG